MIIIMKQKAVRRPFDPNQIQQGQQQILRGTNSDN